MFLFGRKKETGPQVSEKKNTTTASSTTLSNTQSVQSTTRVRTFSPHVSLSNTSNTKSTTSLGPVAHSQIFTNRATQNTRVKPIPPIRQTIGNRANSTLTTNTRTNPFASKVASTSSNIKRAGVDNHDNAVNNPTVSAKNISDMQYRRFAQFLEEHCGIVLGDNKHYLVNSRLSTLLPRYKLLNIDELVNRAMEPGKFKELSADVVDAMTTNETLWFRDTYPYLALKNLMLPELAKKRKNPVRIWSAACSSGQEPYSIAMVVLEQAAQMIKVDPNTTQIVATDISPEMLEKCKKGLYDQHALARGLSAERKSRFFSQTEDPNVMKIDDRIKKMVQFRQLNLLSSYALLGKFDIIFCRNVLIYFNNDVKSQILNKFSLNLNPGGYLILGSSESMSGLCDKYDMVRCNPGIAYRLKPPVY